MAISDFCNALAGQDSLEVDLAIALVWYHTVHEGLDAVGTGDIANELHAFGLTNKVNKTRLGKKLGEDPRTVRASNESWRIHARRKAELDDAYRAFVDPSGKPEHHNLIPLDTYGRIPLQLQHIAGQAEAGYEKWHFDSCAVMMRRLMEALLIRAFNVTGQDAAIKAGKDYLALAGIIGKANSGQCIRLSKGSDTRLELVKDIGDRAAHHQSYKTVQHDIDVVAPKFRALLDELLGLCGL